MKPFNSNDNSGSIDLAYATCIYGDKEVHMKIDCHEVTDRVAEWRLSDDKSRKNYSHFIPLLT
jgi:hypothetical protein